MGPGGYACETAGIRSGKKPINDDRYLMSVLQLVPMNDPSATHASLC